MSLFRKQGYEDTTLEQIAHAAAVSVPTLLVYVESKERLALAPEYETLAKLQQALAEPQRVQTLVLWRAFVEVRVNSATKRPTDYLARVAFYSSAPALPRAMLSILEVEQSALAIALAVDFDTDPTNDLPTQLLATLLSFGTHSVVRHWAADGGCGDLAARALAVVVFASQCFPPPGSAFAQ